MTEDMQVQPFVHVSAIQQPSIGLLSPHDKVMGDMPDRRIRLRILVCDFLPESCAAFLTYYSQWPGYSRYPQVKTIDTSKGQATRADMFHRTAYVVLDFFREMQVNCLAISTAYVITNAFLPGDEILQEHRPWI